MSFWSRSRHPQHTGLKVMALACLGLGLAGCSTAAAQDLQIGDCFVAPPEGTFTTVESQNCDEPHEAEVFAEVSLDIGLGQQQDFESVDDLLEHAESIDTGDLPIGAQQGEVPPVELEQACFDHLIELVDLELLPEDAYISLVGFVAHQLSAQCAIVSPSGNLVGSISETAGS